MILGLLIVHHSILVPPCRIVNSEAFDFCLKELATLKTWVHFQAFAIQFKESVHSVSVWCGYLEIILMLQFVM